MSDIRHVTEMTLQVKTKVLEVGDRVLLTFVQCTTVDPLDLGAVRR